MRASPCRENRITSLRGRPGVLRSDEIEIENSGAEVSESEEAVGMEVSRLSARNFLKREPEPEFYEGSGKRSRRPD